MNSLGAFVFLGVVIAIIICAVVATYTQKPTETTTDNNPPKEKSANETNDLCVDESQKVSTENANCEKSPLSVSSVEIETSINDLKAQIKELKDKQLSTVVKGVLLGLLLWSVACGVFYAVVLILNANSHHSYY
jgi:hypothetical protein